MNFFRPPLQATGNVEARNLIAVANVFVAGCGNGCITFASCFNCLALHNTMFMPTKWAFRILSEFDVSFGRGFEKCSKLTIANNIVVYDRSVLMADW